MVQIDLDDLVIANLNADASRRGITTAELIRWVLGSWSIGALVPGFSPAPASSPDLASLLPVKAADELEVMAKHIRMALAAVGGLSCNQCTQRLTMTDVKKGICSNCEGPIE